MKSIFNSNDNYKTNLSPQEEELFQSWYKTYATTHGLNLDPDDPNHNYDYRGYWKSGTSYNDFLFNSHLPDTYKTPGHETFSIESKYYKFAPGKAGKWEQKDVIAPIPYKWEEFVPPQKIDQESLVLPQRFMESSFKDDAKSISGARGAFGIMPVTEKAYVKATGDTGDIYDYDYNKKIRDWAMNRYYNLHTVKTGIPTDSVRVAKQLAAYNWGEGNLGKFLEKQKNSGVDIYGSLNWIEDLPTETKNYINFILRGKDINQYKNKAVYERLKKKKII